MNQPVITLDVVPNVEVMICGTMIVVVIMVVTVVERFYYNKQYFLSVVLR
jgi:hypothetical protein